jgi:hypothetical protein
LLPNSGGQTSLSNSTNPDAQSDFGLLEYVTVFSREPNVLTDGSTPRFNISRLSFANRPGLTKVLSTALGNSKRAQQIADSLLPPGHPRTLKGHPEKPEERTITSVLGFYVACPEMTGTEFDQVAPFLTATAGPRFLTGLINVNTASETVLACVPGLSDLASQLVSARMNQPQPSTGFAWVKTVLGNEAATKAGPYLTWRSYQVTADVAAVGRWGRGYRRTQFVIDSSLGTSRIVYRRNLAGLGWALGSDARENSSLVGIQNNTQ